MGEYRKNVGVVVFNKDGLVLMCARVESPDNQWQFPQGGIDEGEDVIEAAKRELCEETGITSVELVTKLPSPLRYDFPPELNTPFRRNSCPYVGQEQTWVLFYFTGENSEIDFCTHPEEIEFKDYDWCDIALAPERIIAFKREVYKKVAEAFAPCIRKYINER